MSVSLASKPATDRAAEPAGITFRPDIEGLRAVAVGAVVLGHAGAPFFHGGYVGVDVFFVISGFLITSLLLRERLGTGRISIKGFYARRVTRLLPASALVVAATLVASWLWLPATRFASIVGDALASAFYLVNDRLAVSGTDYLNADAAPSPLQHFWSLAVEEQFYFVWPVLLIVLTVAWRHRTSIRRKPIAAVLAVLVVVSLAISVVQTSASAPWAYFGTQTRVWELALGALVAVAANRLSAIRSGPAAALTWCGLAAVAVSVLWFDDATAYPGYAAALPVVGAAAVIAGGCARPRGGAGLLLDTGPFQFLGKISYGYYLWHWPVLMIGPAALGVAASLKVNLALVAGALVLALLSYHLIENPVRRRKILKQKPWRGIGLGAALSAGTAAIAVA
ncbi:MAG TPA: acyltransferase, partial [Stackebrandtia sp.]|uniref:acyltransferase family protein n=1 Tax=Stackebrandtia sp. TaxID=2023065 RepID=UPI002D3C596A